MLTVPSHKVALFECPKLERNSPNENDEKRCLLMICTYLTNIGAEANYETFDDDQITFAT